MSVSEIICYGELNKVVYSCIYLYCVVKVNSNSDLFDNEKFRKRNSLFKLSHKQTHEGIGANIQNLELFTREKAVCRRQ